MEVRIVKNIFIFLSLIDYKNIQHIEKYYLKQKNRQPSNLFLVKN